MKIFVAESNEDLRLGLQMLLHQDAGIYVVGMAIEAEGLVVQVEASRADVLIVDWYLPGAPTGDLLQAVRELEAPPKTVVLSVNPDDREPALAAGADAFIVKNAPPNDLLETVRSLQEKTVDPSN